MNEPRNWTLEELTRDSETAKDLFRLSVTAYQDMEDFIKATRNGSRYP